MKIATEGITITDVTGVEAITVRPILTNTDTGERFVEIHVRLDGGAEISFDRSGLSDFIQALGAAERSADTLAVEIGEA